MRRGLGRRIVRLSDVLRCVKSSHLVTKANHAAFIGFDLRKMEDDVSVELLKKWNSIANQDRQDRIPKLIG